MAKKKSEVATEGQPIVVFKNAGEVTVNGDSLTKFEVTVTEDKKVTDAREVVKEADVALLKAVKNAIPTEEEVSPKGVLMDVKTEGVELAVMMLPDEDDWSMTKKSIFMVTNLDPKEDQVNALK